MIHSSYKWHQQVAHVIEAIETKQFPHKLTCAISQAIDFTQIAIIEYQHKTLPRFLYSEVPQKKEHAIIDKYLGGSYLLDPWYHAYKNNLNPGLYFLEEIAPDDFFYSEFYREYYRAIEVKNEAVFAIDLGKRNQVQISIGLTEETISKETEQRLFSISPFILAAAKKNWDNEAADKKDEHEEQSIIHEHLSSVFEDFGNHVLTAREREIALLIIRGHSLKSISDLLGVAFGTTKVHCKNIYRKLEIRSQSELFSLFIDAISKKDKRQ